MKLNIQTFQRVLRSSFAHFALGSVALVACSQTASAQARGNTGGQGALGGTLSEVGTLGGATDAAGATGATGTAGTANGALSESAQIGRFSDGFTSAAGNFGAAATTGNLGGLNSGLGGFGLGGFGGGLGGFGLGGFGGGFGGGLNQNSQQQQTIRATVKLGFSMPPIPGPVQTRQVNARMSRLPLPSRFAGVQVQIADRIAYIPDGVSEEDAGLLARLLMLEPGVDDVESEYTREDPSVSDAMVEEVVPPPPTR